jgi:hypothetical protein
MKNINQYKFISLLSIFMIFLVMSCSENAMDKVGENPNDPTNVPTRLIIAQSTVDLAFSISGTDLAWYSSVFCEQTTGVHGQLETADKRTAINTSIGGNSWNDLYTTLKDLDIVINKCSEGGDEAGNNTTKGIAEGLMAHIYSITTDIWGEIPYTEALKGSDIRTPIFDSQEIVYNGIFTLLDAGIADLQKESIGDPGASDFFYGGSAESWIKAAYAIKARLHNRLSNVDGESATKTIAALQNSFADASESMIFTGFNTDATGQNPWYQEQADRGHHAISVTMDDILKGLNDPRRELWFATMPSGEIVPAPNGIAIADQGGELYSRFTETYLTADAPMPIITFDELKFIEAEAQLRSNHRTEAYAAYLDAVEASLIRANVDAADITAYLAQASVSVGEASLDLQAIITQKYISFWLFQPVEAYCDYRRTGIPTMSNPVEAPPSRFPYPDGEISSNPNVPDKSYKDKVWWAIK